LFYEKGFSFHFLFFSTYSRQIAILSIEKFLIENIYTERDSKIGFGRAGILVLYKLNFCHFG
jgi:hypothetical protein